MESNVRNQIYSNLILKSTHELTEIWRKQDTAEWQPVVFEIVEQILEERLGELPPFSADVEAELLLDQAEDNLQKGSTGQALVKCDQAIQLAPDMAEAYTCRGLVYDEMDSPENALADYRKAIQLNPEAWDAQEYLQSLEADLEAESHNSAAAQHLDQARNYALDGEPESALAECAMARQFLPNISAAYNDLGLVLAELKQFEAALEAFATAIQLNPAYNAAQKNLVDATFRFEEEQYRLADLIRQGEADLVEIPQYQVEPLLDLETPADGEPAPGWVYLGEKNFLLPGWPGYRTRPGRSGYDQLDTSFEDAHMSGVMIRLMLVRKFRTHNPIYLLLLTLISLLLCLPLLLLPGMLFSGDWLILPALLLYSPYLFAGVALFSNVILSLITSKPDDYVDNGSAIF